MPKFSKTCNNPLHSEFSEGLEGSTIVNLKAFGLLQFAEALAIFLACEKQIKTTKTDDSPVLQKEELYSKFRQTTFY